MNHINILNFIGYRCIELANELDSVHKYPKEEAARYKKDDPYKIKPATCCPLNSESLVVDVGGYNGYWAMKMFCLHQCFIDIYEPNLTLARECMAHFDGNHKVCIFPWGLGNKTTSTTLYGNNINASIFKNSGAPIEVMLLKASTVFNERYKHINLLKVNIEGAEYVMMADLLVNYDMTKIDNIVIMFHRNVPYHELARDETRKGLSLTHEQIWNYDYIFEYWRKKP